MHDASAPPRTGSMLTAAVLLGIAVRVGLLLAAGDWLGARHAALDTLDLSLFYDGRLYLLVARSFPIPYQDPGSDPIPVDYPNLTIYFPLLPAAIWGVAGVVRDLRLAALVAPVLAGALSILLFARIAQRHVSRPLLATFLFAVFPAEWLLTTMLPFSEALMLLAALAAVVAFGAERHVLAALCAGLAAIAQKSGFLVTGILLLTLLREHGRPDLRRMAPYALAALPALAMQGYLGAVFGDPLVNLRATREVFGAGFFQVPGLMLLNGLFGARALGGGAVWPQRLAVLLSLVFYVGALRAGWRLAHPGASLLRIWVAVVLGFNLALGGIWAYYNFPRFMVLAAPAALLLWVGRFGERLARAPGIALVLVAACLSALLAFESVRDAVLVFERTGVVPNLPAFRDRFF